MATTLEQAFHQEMVRIYYRAKDEAHYKATQFLDMVQKDGGLLTAKTLINKNQPSSGYTALHLRNRLDLTVEAVVVQNAKWHPLFEWAEVARAAERLAKYEYVPQCK